MPRGVRISGSGGSSQSRNLRRSGSSTTGRSGAARSGSLGCGNLAVGGPLYPPGWTGAITMRKGTLVAAIGVLVVVCSACSGSSHRSAVGHPGTTSLGPGGAASGSVSSPPATVPAIPEPEAAGPGASWTVYHGNAEATGVQAAQIKLLPSRRGWGSPILDGEM